jgi:hypothetical protein
MTELKALFEYRGTKIPAEFDHYREVWARAVDATLALSESAHDYSDKPGTAGYLDSNRPFRTEWVVCTEYAYATRNNELGDPWTWIVPPVDTGLPVMYRGEFGHIMKSITKDREHLLDLYNQSVVSYLGTSVLRTEDLEKAL